MASERFIRSVFQPFAADGTADGIIRVPSSKGFKVKSLVNISSNAKSTVQLEIKSIPNSMTIEVGPPGADMLARTDLSGYLVADAAVISQPRQPRRSISPADVDRATYEEEPTVARRVVLTDEFGNMIDEGNPLPVTTDVQPILVPAQSSGQITDGSMTEIFSYTSTNDAMKVVHVEVTVSTPALVRLSINGTTIRELRTSPLERNALFTFHVHRPLPLGQVLKVEAQVDRVIHPTYETFTSLEGYTV